MSQKHKRTPAKTTARTKRSSAKSRAKDPDGLSAPEKPEPKLAREFETSIWFVTLFALLIYWGGMYVDSYGGHFNPLVFNRGDMLADVDARVPKSETDALIAKGRQIYTTYCAACHQPNGQGLAGQFPPLVDSEWVVGVGPNRIIRIVLDGLQGDITVKGKQYNNVMLPWRQQLDDESIAAVVTYIRNNKDWGHSDTGVTAEAVKVIRDATADRSGYWSADELLAIPDRD